MLYDCNLVRWNMQSKPFLVTFENRLQSTHPFQPFLHAVVHATLFIINTSMKYRLTKLGKMDNFTFNNLHHRCNVARSVKLLKKNVMNKSRVKLSNVHVLGLISHLIELHVVIIHIFKLCISIDFYRKA
jgi:hypothetical protein